VTRQAALVEIHGYVGCPFAWRVRLAAAEKQVAADWIPSDVPEPDARSATHNPDDHSPLLWHDGFTLLESEVIGHYLEEAFPGRTLMGTEPRGRATVRLLAAQLASIDVHTVRREEEAVRRSEGALNALEEALQGSQTFLLGDDPGLVDVQIWPFLTNIAVRGLLDEERYQRVAAYLGRAAQRPSFRTTRPPWAAPLVP
jgi:glutathione S-transferase